MVLLEAHSCLRSLGGSLGAYLPTTWVGATPEFLYRLFTFLLPSYTGSHLGLSPHIYAGSAIPVACPAVPWSRPPASGWVPGTWSGSRPRSVLPWVPGRWVWRITTIPGCLWVEFLWVLCRPGVSDSLYPALLDSLGFWSACLLWVSYSRFWNYHSAHSSHSTLTNSVDAFSDSASGRNWVPGDGAGLGDASLPPFCAIVPFAGRCRDSWSPLLSGTYQCLR